MNELIGKAPFFRLLLPVIIGIAAASLLPCSSLLLLLLNLSGLMLMLLSFFIGKKQLFRLRWLFGAGLFLFLSSLSVVQYREQERRVDYTFSDNGHAYRGIIMDIPVVKKRSIACNVKMVSPVEKKVILYLEQTKEAGELNPGEEIIFFARMNSFQNAGNPDDKDYAGQMKIRGFSGSGYVHGTNWQKTGRLNLSIPVMAQRFRVKVLDFYHSFDLAQEPHAFISAVTLGYKAYLTDDLKEAFRASGTAHILAVSGLHVGIIYLIFNSLLSFLGKKGRGHVIRLGLIITLLWGYAFVAGMSSSVVRSVIMLTLYCLGKMQHRRGFTYNTLAATAFVILIFHPSSLFDVSFQMSFVAVFAILYFQPGLSVLYTPQNSVTRYIWNLLTVSTAAQLGVFPLVLYYFGMFPTYFFITNLLVVPIIGIILYAAVMLIAAGSLSFLHAGFIELLQSIFLWIVKNLTELTLRIVYISESLPFAQFSDRQISLLQLLLLFLFIIFAARLLFTHRSRPLIISMASFLLFQTTITYDRLTEQPLQFVVFNNYEKSEIALFDNGKRHPVEIPENGFLPHPDKRIFRLSDSSLNNYTADERFPLDLLILSQYRYFDMEQLLEVFNPSMIVLDSSLPRFAAVRMVKECNGLNIGVHDVRQNGAFSVNF
jgi:competence protein ComEC